MNKILLIIFVIFNNLCIFSQQLNNKNCNIPYHIKTDSLYKLILTQTSKEILYNEYYKKQITETKKKIENLKQEISLDSLMNNLQDSIISKIGEELFCKNFSLDYDCFEFPLNCNNRNIIMRIDFNFILPQIKEDTAKLDGYVHRVSIRSAFIRMPNGAIKTNISYLPKCANNDCNFNISKNQAIKLAKSYGFIKDGDKYRTVIEPYSWEISKGNEYINIDLISGKVSKINKRFLQ